MSEQSASQSTPLGSFPDDGSVRIERLLPGPIEQVWSYLTDPLRLKTWLAGGTIDLRPGGIIDLDFDLIDCPGRENVHGTMIGSITACNPPTLLAYTWGESGSRAAGEPDSLISFELADANGGETLLVLTHTRVLRKDLSLIGAGWHVHLDVLIDRMTGRMPGHFMDAWSLLEPEYRKLL
jgi:uncharacterized protein YndB with AHSA1/START domain